MLPQQGWVVCSGGRYGSSPQSGPRKVQSHRQGGAPWPSPAPEPTHTSEGAGTGAAPRCHKLPVPGRPVSPTVSPPSSNHRGRGAQLGPSSGGVTWGWPRAPRPRAAAGARRLPAPPPPPPPRRSELRPGTSGHPSSSAFPGPRHASAGPLPARRLLGLRLPGDFRVSLLAPPRGMGPVGARGRGPGTCCARLGRELGALYLNVGDLYLNVGDLWAPLSSVLPHSLGWIGLHPRPRPVALTCVWPFPKAIMSTACWTSSSWIHIET